MSGKKPLHLKNEFVYIYINMYKYMYLIIAGFCF